MGKRKKKKKGTGQSNSEQSNTSNISNDQAQSQLVQPATSVTTNIQIQLNQGQSNTSDILCSHLADFAASLARDSDSSDLNTLLVLNEFGFLRDLLQKDVYKDMSIADKLNYIPEENELQLSLVQVADEIALTSSTPLILALGVTQFGQKFLKSRPDLNELIKHPTQQWLINFITEKLIGHTVYLGINSNPADTEDNVAKLYVKPNKDTFSMNSPDDDVMEARMNSTNELIEAIKAHKPQEVKELLQKGVSTNIADSRGYFPIHYAVTINNKEIVDLIINENPDCVNHQVAATGFTALHFARKLKLDDISDILIKAGASDTILSKAGLSSADIKSQYELEDSKTSKQGNDLLERACIECKRRLIYQLLDQGVYGNHIKTRENLTTVQKAMNQLYVAGKTVLGKILRDYMIEEIQKSSNHDLQAARDIFNKIDYVNISDLNWDPTFHNNFLFEFTSFIEMGRYYLLPFLMEQRVNLDKFKLFQMAYGLVMDPGKREAANVMNRLVHHLIPYQDKDKLGAVLIFTPTTTIGTILDIYIEKNETATCQALIEANPNLLTLSPLTPDKCNEINDPLEIARNVFKKYSKLTHLNWTKPYLTPIAKLNFDILDTMFAQAPQLFTQALESVVESNTQDDAVVGYFLKKSIEAIQSQSSDAEAIFKLIIRLLENNIGLFVMTMQTNKLTFSSPEFDSIFTHATKCSGITVHALINLFDTESFNLIKDQPDHNGKTLLNHFVEKGNKEAVGVLLNYLVDVNHVDVKGNTPLSIAFNDRQKGIVELLIDAGAIVDENVINKAIELGRTDLYMMLHWAFKIETSDLALRLLTKAIFYDRINLVRIMLQDVAFSAFFTIDDILRTVVQAKSAQMREFLKWFQHQLDIVNNNSSKGSEKAIIIGQDDTKISVKPSMRTDAPAIKGSLVESEKSDTAQQDNQKTIVQSAMKTITIHDNFFRWKGYLEKIMGYSNAFTVSITNNDSAILLTDRYIITLTCVDQGICSIIEPNAIGKVTRQFESDMDTVQRIFNLIKAQLAEYVYDATINGQQLIIKPCAEQLNNVDQIRQIVFDAIPLLPENENKKATTSGNEKKSKKKEKKSKKNEDGLNTNQRRQQLRNQKQKSDYEIFIEKKLISQLNEFTSLAIRNLSFKKLRKKSYSIKNGNALVIECKRSEDYIGMQNENSRYQFANIAQELCNTINTKLGKPFANCEPNGRFINLIFDFNYAKLEDLYNITDSVRADFKVQVDYYVVPTEITPDELKKKEVIPCQIESLVKTASLKITVEETIKDSKTNTETQVLETPDQLTPEMLIFNIFSASGIVKNQNKQYFLRQLNNIKPDEADPAKNQLEFLTFIFYGVELFHLYRMQPKIRNDKLLFNLFSIARNLFAHGYDLRDNWKEFYDIFKPIIVKLIKDKIDDETIKELETHLTKYNTQNAARTIGAEKMQERLNLTNIYCAFIQEIKESDLPLHRKQDLVLILRLLLAETGSESNSIKEVRHFDHKTSWRIYVNESIIDTDPELVDFDLANKQLQNIK